MNARLKAAKATRDGNFEGIWDGAEAPDAADRFTLDIDGFEGPLDLLLHLAREQRVDMLHISVLALAEQYLVFVEEARKRRLDLAADYLVMAAWLAYLKSRLLLPKADAGKDEPAEELASLLQFRLKRLEAMRKAAQKLMAGRVLGRDVFARGAPEAVIVTDESRFSATLYDLLAAYGAMRQRVVNSSMTIKQRRVWALKEARELLEKLIGGLDEDDWTELDGWLIRYVLSAEERATAIASSFAASLELVKEREIDLRQEAEFAPLMMRKARRPIAAHPTQVTHDD
jgi:segregation and condensation protein A